MSTIEVKKYENNTLGKKFSRLLYFITNINNITIPQEYEQEITKEESIKILEKKGFGVTQNISTISLTTKGEESRISFILIKEEDKKNYEKIKNILGTVFSKIEKRKTEDIGIFVDQSVYSIVDITTLSFLFQKTLLLKEYCFFQYITEEKRHPFTKSHFSYFFLTDKEKIIIENSINKAKTIGNSINFARLLGDLPANELYPQSFIAYVKKEIEKEGIKCEQTVFEFEKLKEMKMGGIVAVGKGSEKPPALLTLKYTPTGTPQKKIALVGKGVTFDTGGISIKPSQGMEGMKADMCGGAAVSASFLALCKLESEHEIHAVIPLAENMVDGGATRPGDIITFYNGKTAEIQNTDAEGRLILADALAYTSKEIKPDIIINLATLTGACEVAVGPVYAGLMSENEELVKQIKEAGEKTGDRCWQLPLEDAYKPNMHSNFADMANIGTKGYRAGSTMGGMFLREFVDKSIAWAHLDIASVATDCPFKKYLPSFGATGFGVSLITKMFGEKSHQDQTQVPKPNNEEEKNIAPAEPIKKIE